MGVIENLPYNSQELFNEVSLELMDMIVTQMKKLGPDEDFSIDTDSAAQLILNKGVTVVEGVVMGMHLGNLIAAWCHWVSDLSHDRLNIELFKGIYGEQLFEFCDTIMHKIK